MSMPVISEATEKNRVNYRERQDADSIQDSFPKFQSSQPIGTVSRSKSLCYEKQTTILRSKSIKDQTNQHFEANERFFGESPQPFSSLQECFNDVMELYSDSINRTVEIDVKCCLKMDTVVEKLNEIEQRRKETREKEELNEKLGLFLYKNISTRLSSLDLHKYQTFISELDKIVLLQLLLRSRLRRMNGNLTDSEKHKKDKLERQLEEANKFKAISDKRMQNIEANIQYYFDNTLKELFLKYVRIKEELIIEQKQSFDLEKQLFKDLEKI